MKANRILLSKIKMKNNCDCLYHVTEQMIYLLRACKFHRNKLN